MNREMARTLKMMDSGYARLMTDEEGMISRVVHVFDPSDWRLELGSLSASPAPVKFDPAVCAVDPAEIGFAPGWAVLKHPPVE
jgi:hypothetical protein